MADTPEADNSAGMRNGPSGRELLALSLVSFFFYTLLAWLLYRWIHGEPFVTPFLHGVSFHLQFLTGLIAGGASAAVVILISSRPSVSQILDDFAIVRAVKKFRLNRFDRWQLSLFAGAGEELLFRGAIQPLIGIWLTSLFFIAIHGYFKFRSLPHFLFGVMMFLLSMMLGLLFELVGLIAAMTAHTVYDLLLLRWVTADRSRGFKTDAEGPNRVGT